MLKIDPDVYERNNYLVKRLQDINGNGTVSNETPNKVIFDKIYIDQLSSLHRDYLLKEMTWLAGDFQKERSRHVSNGKKVAKSIEFFHKGKEVKEIKQAKVFD